MARKTKQTAAAQEIEKARDASSRARSRLASAEKRETGLDQWDYRRAPLSEWRKMWDDPAVRRLFIENFIYVRDENDQKKLVLLKFNDMQDDYYGKRTRQNVVLKMRKGGSSTLHLGIKFANAVVMPGRTVHIVAHNPKTEAKFRRDVRTMHRKLPPHLKPKSQKTDTGGLEFQDAEKGTVDSVIIVYGVQPGFEDSARGDTVTDVLITEMPSMRGDVRVALTAIEEACAADAEVDIESTAKGIEVFHGVYQEGKQRRGGRSAHFYEWWWRRSCRKVGASIERRDGAWFVYDPTEPDAKRNETPVTKAERKVAARILLHLIRRGYVNRGAKWYTPEVAEYIAWRRFKIEQRGENTFLVEYPENDKDCFTQTGHPLVRADLLVVSCKPSGPVEHGEYLIAADTSVGNQSSDPSPIQVLDIHTGRQCREVDVTLPPDLLAYRIAELSDEYNGARIVVERNGPGIATIIKLIELGYEDRLYKHLSAAQRRAVQDGSKTLEDVAEEAQYGFPTGADNKPLLGVKLEEGIRTGALGLSSEAFCEECKTVVWSNDRSWGALPGYHDDKVMALAIGWYVLRTQTGLTGFIGVLPETGYARTK